MIVQVNDRTYVKICSAWEKTIKKCNQKLSMSYFNDEDKRKIAAKKKEAEEILKELYGEYGEGSNYAEIHD